MSNEQTIAVHDLIKWALQEHTEREIAAYPSPMELKELYPDTSAFRNRFWKEIAVRKKAAIKGGKRVVRVLKRTLLVAAVAAALFCGMVLVSADLRAYLKETYIEWTERNVDVRYEVAGDLLTALPEGYSVRYMPENFAFEEEESENRNNIFFRNVYRNADGHFIQVTVRIAENASMVSADTEHTTFEDIPFGENGARLGTFHVGDGYMMFWLANGIEHELYVNAHLSREEVLRIAENIK